MKIVHIFYSLEIGGVETLLVNIANWQISKGFNVTIILINDLYDTDLIKALDEKIDVIKLKRRLKSKNPFTIIKLNYFLFINRYDILHIHSAGIGNIILSFLKVKKVLHVHSTTFITNTRIPKFNKCIAISNSVKQSLKDKYKINNVDVIYNGINFDRFIKKASTIITNKMIIVGRLDIKIKNQDGVIKEFAAIKNKIDANLYIIGDGPDKDKLLQLVKQLKLENRVYILGQKDQHWIQKKLFNYDLLIQASKSEGLGLSAIEASAACVPLLLSNVDGHIEISKNGQLCNLFDVNEFGKLGESIVHFYLNPKLGFINASSNYKIYKKRFNFELCNQKIVDIYQSL